MPYKFNPFTGTFDEVKDISDKVDGPASAIDNSLVIYDGITGKLVKDGTISIHSIKNTQSTGVISEGVLSIGTPTSTFSISDGSGCIVDSSNPTSPTILEISWTGQTNITVTNLATNLITFVAMQDATTIIQQTTPFTPEQRRSLIVLGVVVHVDNTVVDAVNNEQVTALNPTNQLYDLMESIAFFNVTGNIISSNGSNLNINKSNGEVFKAGSNYDSSPTTNPHIKALATLTQASFQYRFSDGSNGTTGIAIDPDNLEDGAGGLVALSNNRWSIQRVYSFTSNNIKIQRGIEAYTSKENAIAGIISEAYITEPSIVANGLLRGFIISKKGTTDLSDISDALFLEASKFQSGGTNSPGIATDMQGSYDNSTNTEIVLNSVNEGIQIQDNATPIGVDLFSVEINGGATKFFNIDVNGFTGDGITASRALASDSNGAVKSTSVTSTEQGYLSGVTSAIQTQLGTKAVIGDVFNITSSSGVFTATVNETHLVDTSGGVATITLPAAVTDTFVRIKDKGNANTNNITVNTPGAETIDGAASDVIDSDFGSIVYISDGTNWFKL